MGLAVGDQGEVKSEPNVIPMIDVMLVLLIIFMIVTPVISSGMQAKMPMGRNIESEPEEDLDVVLGIDNRGDYFLDPGDGTVRPVRRDSLESYLTQVFDSRTKDKILYFKADQNLDYGAIQDAVEIARSAGVRVLAAVTEEPARGLMAAGREGG